MDRLSLAGALLLIIPYCLRFRFLWVNRPAATILRSILMRFTVRWWIVGGHCEQIVNGAPDDYAFLADDLQLVRRPSMGS